MSDSMQPHRRQLTRVPRPWDFPDKNTGVGCHFLLQHMKVESESEVAQSCPTLSNSMDCSLQAPPSMGFSRQAYRSWVPLQSTSSMQMKENPNISPLTFLTLPILLEKHLIHMHLKCSPYLLHHI